MDFTSMRLVWVGHALTGIASRAAGWAERESLRPALAKPGLAGREGPGVLCTPLASDRGASTWPRG